MSIITVVENNEEKSYTFEPGIQLLELLRMHGYVISAPCGGRGKCGKCTVLLADEEGERKTAACSHVLQRDCKVFIPDDSADFSWNDAYGLKSSVKEREGLGAAVDLGTTTVAVSLFNLQDGKCLSTLSRWNTQQSFGADVISRIGFCMDQDNGLETLSSRIRNQVLQMTEELCNSKGADLGDVKEIFVAGNTVMQHIFAGISPESIAAAPFKPASYFDEGKAYDLNGIPVSFSPCAAGYVGGDILAGILSTEMDGSSEKTLLIDIGTNGEMVFGNRDGFVSCAVASGPAFEGAGICCGMAAAKGAIYSVEPDDDGLRFSVLDGGEAVGICGSGILDLIACLLELGYIDETGRLESDDGSDRFYLTDDVFITQNDIRQIQLAKAAVAAGIELLMKEEQVDFGDIEKVTLAGGFGNRLKAESAVRIGMLPRELIGKIQGIGNASLSGAQAALLNPEERDRLIDIKKRCRYIELSSNPSFNDCFIENMTFPEDDYEY